MGMVNFFSETGCEKLPWTGEFTPFCGVTGIFFISFPARSANKAD